MFFENLQRDVSKEIHRLVSFLEPMFEPNTLPSPDVAAHCATYNQTGEWISVL